MKHDIPNSEPLCINMLKWTVKAYVSLYAHVAPVISEGYSFIYVMLSLLSSQPLDTCIIL